MAGKESLRVREKLCVQLLLEVRSKHRGGEGEVLVIRAQQLQC